MDDKLRTRLDACITDDIEEQAEAVPELIALVEKLDAKVEEVNRQRNDQERYIQELLQEIRKGEEIKNRIAYTR